MADENIIKMDRFNMADDNIIKTNRFKMADENIIKKDRFNVADETSSYFAPSSVVSNKLYDGFFTDATNEYYVRFTHYMHNLRFKWRRGGVEDLRLTPYSQYLRFIHNYLNFRFIHKYLNLRFKRRRGRGGQKGVGARRFQGGPGPAYYYWGEWTGLIWFRVGEGGRHL